MMKKSVGVGVCLLSGAVLVLLGQNFTYLAPINISSGVKAASYTMAIPNSDINDFLIQDICVDEMDRPVAQDPINCSRRRNLRIGEDLPYAKYARRGNGAAISMQNSYPVWGGQFFRVVRTMNKDSSSYSGRDYDTGDGYDVMENQGTYASIMGTRDPVTTDENFVWFGSGCRKEDSWILFPNNVLGSLGLNQSAQVGTQGIGATACDHNTKFNPSVTNYAHLNFTYASGKTLETLRSRRFPNTDPGKAGSIEVFYHTRLYGLTRWEAWKTASSCLSVQQTKYGKTAAQAKEFCDPANLAKAAAAEGICNGPVQENYYGTVYVRTICIDSSHVKPLALPIHGFSTPLTTTFAQSRNFLRDADFVSKNPSLAWNRTHPGEVNWSIAQDAEKNASLKLNVVGALDGSRGVKQIAEITEWSEELAMVSVGALVKGPSDGHGVISISLLNVNDAVLDTKIMQFRTHGGWAPVRFYFPWNQRSTGAKKVVFSFLPGTGHEYGLDEAFVAFVPHREDSPLQPEGFFTPNSQDFYYSNGDTAFCKYGNMSHFMGAGGSSNGSNARRRSGLPSQMANHGICQTSPVQREGFFAPIGWGNVLYSNGVNAYCSFANWDHFILGGGRPDGANINWSGAGLPSGMANHGQCGTDLSGLRWSSAGPIPGMTCNQWLEAADPHTWSDNYLCWPAQRDLKLRFNSAGPIPGMYCTQIAEAADQQGTWMDNYLCSSYDMGLRFSSAGPIPGKTCLKIDEPAEPAYTTWNDNYVCY